MSDAGGSKRGQEGLVTHCLYLRALERMYPARAQRHFLGKQGVGNLSLENPPPRLSFLMLEEKGLPSHVLPSASRQNKDAFFICPLVTWGPLGMTMGPLSQGRNEGRG